MFIHFLNTLKKIAISFFTLTLLSGVVACKPSVEYFNVIYGDRVETYHHDPTSTETQTVEIESDDQITIEVISSDKQPEDINHHKYVWNIQGQDASEWAINGVEERDEFFIDNLEDNKITLKGPQQMTSEITVEFTVICTRNPELSTSVTFTVKSVSGRTLEQLHKETQATAELILNRMLIENDSVELETTDHVHQRQIIRSVTKDFFENSAASVEEAEKKLDFGKKLLATVLQKKKYTSEVAKSIYSTEHHLDCLQKLKQNHGFFSLESELKYNQQLCKNNLSDLSYRDGRRRLKPTDYIPPTSAMQRAITPGLMSADCWNLDFTLAVLPEMTASKVAAADLLPICYAISAIGPALYYLDVSKDKEKNNFPYIFRQKYFTHIYYSPILSYRILNGREHIDRRGVLLQILDGKCRNAEIPCIVDIVDKDINKIDQLKQTLDEYAKHSSGDVSKREKLRFVQSEKHTGKPLKNNQYRVTLNPGLLELENDQFETILWSPQAPNHYYFKSPRYINSDYVIRMPVNNDQQSVLQYISDRVSKHSKAGSNSMQIIDIENSFIKCGGGTITSSQKCSYYLTFGATTEPVNAGSNQTAENQIISHSNAQVMVEGSSLVEQNEATVTDKYCRSVPFYKLKRSEAEMIRQQGEDMRVGCFSVVVKNSGTFRLPFMSNVISYYIDCDADNEDVDLAPGKSCLNVQGNTKITVFLVFHKDSFYTNYTNLFMGDTTISEFDELPPYGSQGGSGDGYGVTSYRHMFARSLVEKVNMNTDYAMDGAWLAGMFTEASYFRGDGNISSWNTRKITNTSSMFEVAALFNGSLNRWDMSNVVKMTRMFKDAYLFNQVLNKWDVSRVKDMASMFDNAENFQGGISEWDVTRVENMSSMFRNTPVFNSDIGQWDVANVKNMSYMFFDAKKFNRSLADWDVSNVNYMTHIFNGATNFAQNLSTWRISESIFLTDVYRKNMFDRSYLAGKRHLQP